MTKRCTKCDVEQGIEQYPAHKSYRGGHTTWCRTCLKARAAIWAAQHKQRMRDMGRKYDRNHPRTKANVKFRLRYGITIEQYEQMVSVQDNKCALCGQDGSLSPKGKLCVDHCHATRKVRGLLCNGCNAGLGYFRDDPNLLDKAIEYLKHNS